MLVPRSEYGEYAGVQSGTVGASVVSETSSCGKKIHFRKASLLARAERPKPHRRAVRRPKIRAKRSTLVVSNICKSNVRRS